MRCLYRYGTGKKCGKVTLILCIEIDFGFGNGTGYVAASGEGRGTGTGKAFQFYGLFIVNVLSTGTGILVAVQFL
jgi:hypothetical protein